MKTWNELEARAAIKRIPRHIPRKGQHYTHMVAEIKRRYGVTSSN